MFCPNCGKEVPKNTPLCADCGAVHENIATPTPAESPRSRVVYVILAFFFGALGIHNFYAGRKGIAIAQLLITVLSCWVLAFAVAVWALLEMILVNRDGQGNVMTGNKVLVIVLVILALISCGISGWIGVSMAVDEIVSTHDALTTRSSFLNNETAFYVSQGTKTGDFLTQNYPGKKILLVAEPEIEYNLMIQKLADKLKESYEGEVVLETVNVAENSGDTFLPPYMRMKAADFDAVVNRHPDCGIIVTTIGLPQDAGNLAFTQRPAGERPVLFLIGLSSLAVPGLRQRLEEGTVAGMILRNPQAQYDLPAPSDPLQAFDIRYVLVTRENAAEYEAIFLD